MYWRHQCFEAYEALIEIERCAGHGASSEVIAHLAHEALRTTPPDAEHGQGADQAKRA